MKLKLSTITPRIKKDYMHTALHNNSPNTNLEARNRSNSRVTTSRDRIRCYRCREYYHIANECPNAVADDSDCYESDRVAL